MLKLRLRPRVILLIRALAWQQPLDSGRCARARVPQDVATVLEASAQTQRSAIVAQPARKLGRWLFRASIVIGLCGMSCPNVSASPSRPVWHVARWAWTHGGLRQEKYGKEASLQKREDKRVVREAQLAGWRVPRGVTGCGRAGGTRHISQPCGEAISRAAPCGIRKEGNEPSRARGRSGCMRSLRRWR